MATNMHPDVESYLEEMRRRLERQDSPEYQQSLGAERTDNANFRAQMAGISGITQGLAQVGTLGGKTPSTKPVTDTYGELINQSEDQDKMTGQDEADQARRMGMQLETYKYVDALRKQKDAQLRQGKQDAVDSRLKESQIAKNLREPEPKEGKTGSWTVAAGVTMPDGSPAMINSKTGQMQPIAGTKTPKEPSKSQYDAAGFARRLEQSEDVFKQLTDNGYNRADASSAAGARLPDVIRSGDSLSQEQAERNFVNAVLRRESGAAISPSEFMNAEKQYFPRAGDTPDVLAQKRANRQQVMTTLKAEASLALDKVPKVGIPAPIEQQPAGEAAAKAAPKAGDIVRISGKRYKVGDDGNTLTEIP